MQEAEQKLLSSGIAWYDKWNCSGAVSDTPSCHFEASDVPVASGHIHQARYFLGPSASEPRKVQRDLEPGTALVCLHGFGAGVGIYYSALPALRAAWNGPVFALDWFGCSLSSRPKWTLGHGEKADPAEIECFFIEPLEQWRAAAGIERMVIVGHSMGGLFGACYAARFPQHVEKLLLVSPAGVTGKVDLPPTTLEARSWMATLGEFMWSRAGINPLMAIWRLSPLMGRGLLRKWFSKFGDESWLDKERLVEYHYQSTLNGEISGGHCLTGLLEFRMCARRPLSRSLTSATQVSFIYGAQDSHFQGAAPGLATLRDTTGSEPQVIFVAGAGHDMMVDNPLGFSESVIACFSKTVNGETFGEAAMALEAATQQSSKL